MTTTHSLPKNPSNPSITVPLTPPQPEVPAETPDISNLSLADDVDREDDTFGSGSSDQSTLSNIDERALNRALQLFRDGEIEEEEVSVNMAVGVAVVLLGCRLDRLISTPPPSTTTPSSSFSYPPKHHTHHPPNKHTVPEDCSLPRRVPERERQPGLWRFFRQSRCYKR